MELYPLDILIHIVNIVVTYILLRMLLYKPVRKFMDERAAKIEHQMEHARLLEQAAAEGKTAYEAQIADSEQKARELIREGEQKALLRQRALRKLQTSRLRRLLPRQNRRRLRKRSAPWRACRRKLQRLRRRLQARS